jgi:hypothetical protein
MEKESRKVKGEEEEESRRRAEKRERKIEKRGEGKEMP